MFMRDDYVITIFSRRQGKTRSITLRRRLLSWAVGTALVVVVLAMVLIYALVTAIQERRVLQGEVSQLQETIRSLETRVEDLVGRKSTESRAPSVSGEGVSSESHGRPFAAVESARAGGEAKVSEPLKVKIERPKAMSLESGVGFRLEFRLSNLTHAPVSGAMAIIASRTSPSQPRFVSSPAMELAADGTPVNVRKSARFSIRHFRYVNGIFSFPYAQAESFRILIYNGSWQLVSDILIPATQVESGRAGSPQSS